MSINIIESYLKNVNDTLSKVSVDKIDAAITLIQNAYLSKQTIFIIGNGGSAATSSHLAEDLSKGCACDGKPSLKALSLTDNTPLLTALSNDYCYEDVFKKQLEIFYQPKDMLIAISASGNSKNIVRAVDYVKGNYGTVIGLTGFKGGYLYEKSDVALHVPFDDFGIVEDLHLMISHIVTESMKHFIKKL
ncbi:MAG: SIS domain-containing protein [Fibrobacteres bacterium]|nr:SIS domain-containing protein [Fibrobacterota bacterium]